MARYENGNNTREQIIDTAKKLFFEQGSAKVSLNDLAKQAHVAKNSIRYHFRTKKELSYGISEKIIDSIFTTTDENAKLECLKWPVSSYIFWYRFINDEQFRRFYIEDIGQMKFESDDFVQIYAMLKTTYDIPQSLKEFSEKNAFECRSFINVLYDLIVYCSEKIKENDTNENISYEWATEQEIRICSRIFGIPDEKIAMCIEAGKTILGYLDIEVLGAELG